MRLLSTRPAHRLHVSLGLSVLLWACVPDGPDPALAPHEVKVGDQRAYVVDRDETAGNRVMGNVALETPSFGIEVQARGREGKGALIAIRDEGRAYDFEALQMQLAVDGRVLAPSVLSVSAARYGKRPAIEVLASAQTATSRLAVQRLLLLADAGKSVRIRTSVRTLSGPRPKTLAVIERIAWGGGEPIVPAHGPLAADQPVAAEWVGRAIGERSLVLGPLAGSARITGRSVDHARVDLLRFTDVEIVARDQDDALVTDAVLSASRHGLAQTVRQLGWVRGKPFVEACAVLTTRPPDAQVEVVEAETGRLVIAGVPDEQRRVLLPLPDALVGKPLLLGASARGAEASDWVKLEGPPYTPVQLAIPESSVLRVEARYAVSGEPMPVRVRVLSERGTPAPRLGPDWNARGALDTVIAPTGIATLRLPAGYYRVVVTHGPEFSVIDRKVELDVGKTTVLRADLERAIDPGPWIAAELHVHAAPSPDSQVSLEDRVASLVAEGIAFAVPTDHNHVTDFGPAIRAQPKWGLMSVPGVEVTTGDPVLGHFNAYPFPLDLTKPGQGAPEPIGRAPSELFASLRAIDPSLVIQINHPRLEGGIGYLDVAEYDSKSDRGNALFSPDFDALEVWNGFDLARFQNLERTLADFRAMIGNGYRIVATGSSDSHTIRSEGAGYPRTYIRAKLSGVAQGRELVQSLKEGRAFVTSGPFVNAFIGEHSLGDSVELGNEPMTLDLFVQVPIWMQVTTIHVYLGSTLLRSMPIGPPSSGTPVSRRYKRSIPLRIDKPGALTVTVEGDAPLDPVIARRGVKPFAFTNPIWLVAPTP